jgi:aryl-alcohol dehydrogenase-like predicted oxidoreductase
LLEVDDAAAHELERTTFAQRHDVAPPKVSSLLDMERRRLGASELEISRVGIGTAPIGSGRDWPVWWGPQDEGDSIRAIRRALDLGVNWIDTAPFYGWGRAEEIVARAIEGRRDGVLLFTKCGTMPNESGSRMDLRPERIRADLEASLRRLRTDVVDLLQFHDVDRSTPIEESWGELQQLVSEGKVRYGGISNHPAAAVERALAVGPVAALQYEYSLLHRQPEGDILPLAREHGIGVLSWAPLASGFLTGELDLDALDRDDFRRTHPYAALDLAPLRSTLGTIGDRRGRTQAQVALAWVLAQAEVTGAIVGIRNEREAEQLPGAADWRLGQDELREIESAAP